MTEQLTFASGVMYSYQELPPDTARALINYDFADRGASLKPRKGLKAQTAIFNGAEIDAVSRGTGDIQNTVHAGCVVYEAGQTKTEVTPLGLGLGKPFGNVFMNLIKGVD